MVGATIYNIVMILAMSYLSISFDKWWIVLFALLFLWLPEITYMQNDEEDN